MESQDSNIRKRVCKACDRCRLKKSKCDGSNPCTRCKADNAICVFGERKKSHDKVYPKGYVEMLEQQQTQLVAGMRELYRRMQTGEGWPGRPLAEQQGGHPLTHDILERLDLLHSPDSAGSHYEGFEEDCSRMQQRLVENGAPYIHRRGSFSSDSDHGHVSSPASYSTPPTKSSQPHFTDPFARQVVTPPTPTLNSPPPGATKLQAYSKDPTTAGFNLTAQPGFDAAQVMRSPWAMSVPAVDDMTMKYFSQIMDQGIDYDTPMYDELAGQTTINPVNMADWSDPSDVDFSTFINPITT